MTKNTLFTIFICSILLSGSFFAISSSLNFSPFVFAQEQQAESTTDPPADTSTTDPPADTSTTDPPADTSTDPSIVTLQHDDVEINQPVQWTATVDVADPQQTIAIEVPSDAQNTLVMNSDGQIVEASVISDPSLLDTTTDVAEITDPKVMEENAETDLVVVDEPGEILNIEFETSAPYTEEAELVTEDSYQKTVTVKSDSELHYTNVKSYSDLPEDLAASGVEFKLYWMIDGVKTDVTSDPRFAVEFVDTDGNGIADQMQWIVPQLSEQVFVIEAVITIITVQSFPMVGGEWVVRFTTTGTADLTITGIDGTTFGETEPDDLKFLELNDGTQTLTPEISGNSIIYRNYSSDAEGFERSLVLTSGEHHLEFKFGNDIEVAHNLANAIQKAWEQCRNDADNNNENDSPLCSWLGGNLGGSNGLLVEGNNPPDNSPTLSTPTGTYDATPTVPGHVNYRYIQEGLGPDDYVLRIGYGFSKGGEMAFDFLTTPYGVTDTNICTQLPSGVLCSTTGVSTFTIPYDSESIPSCFGGGDVEDRQVEHETAFAGFPTR